MNNMGLLTGVTSLIAKHLIISPKMGFLTAQNLLKWVKCGVFW